MDRRRSHDRRMRRGGVLRLPVKSDKAGNAALPHRALTGMERFSFTRPRAVDAG